MGNEDSLAVSTTDFLSRLNNFSNYANTIFASILEKVDKEKEIEPHTLV